MDDGLSATLAGMMRTVPVAVDIDVRADWLPDDVATTASFVVSEAVAKAVKHAQADRISVCVTSTDGRVLVRVVDDGCGGAAGAARTLREPEPELAIILLSQHLETRHSVSWSPRTFRYLLKGRVLDVDDFLNRVRRGLQLGTTGR